MPISFNCPECGSRTTVHLLSPGAETWCRSCGVTLEVPRESDPDPVRARDTLEISSEPPARDRRLLAMLTDVVAWPITMIVLWGLMTQVGYALFGHPPTTTDPRDDVVIFAMFPAILGANFVFAVGNAFGISVGKAWMGLRLVARVGDCQVRPGLRRGMVRATLQWLPMPHDGFAGTHVVQVAEGCDWKALPPRAPSPPRLPIWMVVLAVLAQCPFAFALMIGGAM